MKVFQFYDENKSWKLSLELFLNLFYIVGTSQNGACDQGLIIFHPHDPWFDYFTHDWSNFLRRFMLVKPVNPEARLTLCYSLAEFYYFYK